MIEFFGRLHPLIVHLPIGILLLTAALNFLSRSQKHKSFIGASRVALFVGAVSAVFACASGLALEDSSYDSDIITRHKYLGIVTAFLSLLLLWMSNVRKLLKKRIQKNIGSALYLFLILLIFTTGHMGGSLTHGEGFLIPDMPSNNFQFVRQKSFDSSASIYSQLVQPLLQEKCYNCHSSKKQKGKLRLDTEEFILKGGKSGPIFSTPENGESEMLFRIHLPIEDDDHMPPSDNGQLSSGEIDLLTTWVKSGASFNRVLSTYPDSTVLISYINSKFTVRESRWWPTNDTNAPDQDVVNELIQAGVTLEFLSKESNYLMASFVSLDSLPKNIWENLFMLKDNLVSIRFSGIELSQNDLNNLASLARLRKLYLDESIEASLNLGPVSNLKELLYLNLSRDTLSKDQISTLSKLQSLESLYLFQTNIQEEDLKELKKELPNCEFLQASYLLPELSTDTLVYRKK